MDNILDQKDSKGKVGGGRKEQKRNFKDKKFGRSKLILSVVCWFF